MTRQKHIGIWSTKYEELTGQGIVTRRVVDRVLSENAISREYVFRPTARPPAIVSWAIAVARLWLDLLFGRVAKLYIVCSRSNGGFVRDIPALLAAKFDIPVIVHSHGSDIVDLLSARRFSAMARWLYKDCRLIIPSAHLLEPLSQMVREVVVCENFNPGVFEELDDSREEQPAEFIVFWGSNVMASKGFFDVIAAVRDLRADGYPVKMLSVGGLVPDQELGISELKEKFDEIGSPDWFDYRGKQPHRETARLLQEAHVVCLPSRYKSELQPIVLIEAMCFGKAIIAADTAALRATLAGYTADYVSEKSVSELTRALRSLYNGYAQNPSLFQDSHSKQVSAARKRFSGERFDREMKRILKEACFDSDRFDH